MMRYMTEPFSAGNRISNPLPHEDPTNTRNGRHQFRVMRAAQGFLPGGQGLTGLEKEVSQEITERSGIPSNWGGFKIPYSTRTQTHASLDRIKRALDSNAGAGSIPTVLEADWIELLRNKMVVMDAGAREVLDLKGKFAIPARTLPRPRTGLPSRPPRPGQIKRSIRCFSHRIRSAPLPTFLAVSSS